MSKNIRFVSDKDTNQFVFIYFFKKKKTSDLHLRKMQISF